MQLSISKKTGTEEILFRSEIPENNCSNAKQVAVDTDAAFEIVLPDPAGEPLIIPLNAMIGLLQPDKETEDLLHECYTAANMIGTDKIAVALLFITCSGRISLSVSAPEIDGGIAWEKGNSIDVGLGFSFQGGIRFVTGDMKCINE